MISVAFKTPLKNKIGNLYLLNCTSESTRWLHWFRTKLSPPHFTTKLRPYLHPLFTGLIKTEKFSFSEMLRREFYLWPLAKKLYDGWINTMTLSNENSWKLPPPEMKSWLRPWCHSLPLFVTNRTMARRSSNSGLYVCSGGNDILKSTDL